MSTQVATSVSEDPAPACAAAETALAGRRRLVGIALMCGAVAFFASLDASAKTLARAGVDPLDTTFMRYAASVAMISLFINPVRTPGVVVDGILYETEPKHPDPMPDCLGVRAGSTRGCGLWVRRQRW